MNRGRLSSRTNSCRSAGAAASRLSGCMGTRRSFCIASCSRSRWPRELRKVSLVDQITLENVYPLNQRQRVLLLDAGYAPDARELTETWSFVLRGELSQARFAAAWEEICKRHLALCTTLVWKRVERPLQIVQRQARMPLRYFDWRELKPAQQFAEFVKLVREEEEQGFNFAQPPLVRLSVCRTGDDVYQGICAYSALLFDRGLMELLFGEALRFFAGDVGAGERKNGNGQLPELDYSSAHEWWSRALAEFRPAALTAARGAEEPESFYGEAEFTVEETLGARLGRAALSLEI